MLTSTDPAAQRLPALPQVDVYHGADGVPVVDIDTAAAGADGHDGGGVPYLRVVVNDDYVYEHNPPQPFAGSCDALDLDCETGPNDEHRCTLREGDAEDALQIAGCIGMEPLIDPGWYPHLEERGLITVHITPGAHKHASTTSAGEEILGRALPQRGKPYPEF